MRKMMLAASLMTFAACGSVQDGPATGSDMTAGEPDAGVPAALVTIDPTGFVVDGSTWWTNSSSPALHGTFKGSADAKVDVHVGATSVPATIDGSTWSVTLPPGSIATSNTAVSVTMTDPTGATAEVTQTIGLDSAPPAIVVGPSSVSDERDDAIDFSTGEPIHTHAAPTTDLSAAGCPGVYKYAYLMDATAPVYGSATSPNDLAWRVRIADAKLEPDSQQFRVRTSDNQVLISWTALPAPDGTGYSTIKLTRSGGAFAVAALGTRTGQFFIDVRARDWAGQQTTSSICFDHHPLAAPVKVEAFTSSELFGMSMSGDSPMSKVVSWDGSVGIVKQRIIQQTNESVAMTWSSTTMQPHYTSTTFGGWAAEYQPNNVMCPAGNTKPQCVMASQPSWSAPSESTTSGVTQHAKYSVIIRDESTNQIVQVSSTPSVSWTIPARTTSEPPHPYSIEVVGSAFIELAAPWGEFDGLTAEHTLMSLGYSGTTASTMSSGCATMTQTAFGPMCSQSVTYWLFTAMDRATLGFDSFDATITTGIDAQTMTAVRYVPTSATTSGSLSWDSGDDDLPGMF